ncbi:hypothetical protein BJ085DRAFT_32618 [Dimargaris cristalligena]|uniref:Uncharacterized protein n=1 Tax=Dimargaris cristalligena TaxID=215637 RepID=A0A4P9ZRD0_9FUNG|nr:hypothetical protein BJ085DRAFT_32618 [Dimargaris cristalligena]|eukprot:RKP35905.1 hypothetical protein BJ085DRAFT_32618 [Dimargaris cristalligena]
MPINNLTVFILAGAYLASISNPTTATSDNTMNPAGGHAQAVQYYSSSFHPVENNFLLPQSQPASAGSSDIVPIHPDSGYATLDFDGNQAPQSYVPNPQTSGQRTDFGPNDNEHLWPDDYLTSSTTHSRQGQLTSLNGYIQLSAELQLTLPDNQFQAMYYPASALPFPTLEDQQYTHTSATSDSIDGNVDASALQSGPPGQQADMPTGNKRRHFEELNQPKNAKTRRKSKTEEELRRLLDAAMDSCRTLSEVAFSSAIPDLNINSNSETLYRSFANYYRYIERVQQPLKSMKGEVRMTEPIDFVRKLFRFFKDKDSDLRHPSLIYILDWDDVLHSAFSYVFTTEQGYHCGEIEVIGLGIVL